jgi:hypothetical protein
MFGTSFLHKFRTNFSYTLYPFKHWVNFGLSTWKVKFFLRKNFPWIVIDWLTGLEKRFSKPICIFRFLFERTSKFETFGRQIAESKY